MALLRKFQARQRHRRPRRTSGPVRSLQKNRHLQNPLHGGGLRVTAAVKTNLADPRQCVESPQFSTFNPQLLLQHFEALAETPEARDKIQQLVLDFAVRGRLNTHSPKEGAFDLEAAQSVNDPDLKAPSSEEQPFPIPGNWVWGRFGQVFNIEGGTQPPKDQFIASPRNGYIRLLQIRDFGHRRS